MVEAPAVDAGAEVPAAAMRRANIGAGTVFNLIARFAFLASGYGLHIGLARILGPASYGVVGVVLPLVTIARVLVMDGPRQAISKFTAENERLAVAIRNTALRLEGAFSALVMVALLGGAGLIALVLRDATLAPYIRLVAPMVPFTAAMSVYLASLNGLGRFGRQAIGNGVNSVGRVVFAVAGAWLWGLPGALLGLVAAPLVAGIVAGLLLPKGKEQGQCPVGALVSFSLPMIGFAVADALLLYLDVLFVKALLGQGAQVGFYTSASTVAQIPYYALLPLADTLLPVTAYLLAQGNKEPARLKIRRGLRYGLILLLPAAALVSATAQPLARFLFGGAYALAGAPLALLIWGQTFYAFSTVLTSILIAEGKPRLAMVLAAALLPISAVANVVLVPRWGLLGAASATAIATLAGLIASLTLVQRDLGPVFAAGSTLKIAAAAALAGLLALVWRPQGLGLVAAYAVLWALDFLVLWLLREIKPDDLQQVRRLLARYGGRRR